jgi:hypothetical protein
MPTPEKQSGHITTYKPTQSKQALQNSVDAGRIEM